jgi:small-conductance mechanosensitive channel
MTALTESMKHYTVQRQMLREVKLELDKNKIEIPYNQVVVHNG